MFDLYRIIIDHFVDQIQTSHQRTYSNMEPEVGNIVCWTGRLALEIIANSDALYHNLEHTVMVTMAGQAIIEGKHLAEGGVSPKDWMHFTIALLCHDIGYVRGILEKDTANKCATGIGDEMFVLPEGSSDISLTPYHVDRSKQFVRERFGEKLLDSTRKIIDVERIVSHIEMTRFPPPDDQAHADTAGYGGLVRAADFIGQMGDPNYMRKSAALFYEFEETNANQQLGYRSPADLRRNYARFFWDVVNPFIKDSIKYLEMTQQGKQWIANLHSHVFASEHAEDG